MLEMDGPRKARGQRQSWQRQSIEEQMEAESCILLTRGKDRSSCPWGMVPKDITLVIEKICGLLHNEKKLNT